MYINFCLLQKNNKKSVSFKINAAVRFSQPSARAFPSLPLPSPSLLPFLSIRLTTCPDFPVANDLATQPTYSISPQSTQFCLVRCWYAVRTEDDLAVLALTPSHEKVMREAAFNRWLLLGNHGTTQST